jgi:hypothetical protein
MQVWLPDAVKNAGGKIKLAISFEFIVPEYGTDRMGRLKTKNGWVYEVAQWYPRMCVYDDVQGWNTLPYLGAGEFYLEYGDIDFTITAPSNLIVVGSGELQNQKDCYTAEQMKRWDAAKNSDKTVIIRSDKEVTDPLQDPNKPTAPGNSGSQMQGCGLGGVKSICTGRCKDQFTEWKKIDGDQCLPAESIKKNGWQRSTEMVKGAIEFYSKKWFEFPYPAATNVAGIVGGMEYPGIVFCSHADSGGSLWGVTDHEFGHTWFPMIVGSNERKYAWMDEGFNTYINEGSTQHLTTGDSRVKLFWRSNSSFHGENTRSEKKWMALYTIPEVIQQDNLGVAAYMKPAQMLTMLREVVLGKERFEAAFREYVSRWAFKHPTPWDFFHTIENVSGEDLGWFWRAWVLNTWKLDQTGERSKICEGRSGKWRGSHDHELWRKCDARYVSGKRDEWQRT